MLRIAPSEWFPQMPSWIELREPLGRRGALGSRDVVRCRMLRGVPHVVACCLYLEFSKLCDISTAGSASMLGLSR